MQKTYGKRPTNSRRLQKQHDCWNTETMLKSCNGQDIGLRVRETDNASSLGARYKIDEKTNRAFHLSHALSRFLLSDSLFLFNNIQA